MVKYLHLGSGAGPCVSIPCLLQDTSRIYWLHPPRQLTRKKKKNPEIRFNSQQIVSYCLGLHIQSPRLREVDLEPSPKRRSDKINMLKYGRKTAEENKSYRTTWTHKWMPALREVDLEPSAKRGANRTKALGSLYWSSRSMPPKETPNPISNKSTKVDPIWLSRTWKKSFQNSKSYALQNIKTFFSRIQGQLMPMTGVISGVVTPRDKTKSNPLARLKLRIFSKSVVSF